MNAILQKSLQGFTDDILTRSTAYETLSDIITKIQLHSILNECERAKSNFYCAETLNSTLVDYIRELENQNKSLVKELTTVQQAAKTVREKFVSNLSHFLLESKANKKLRERLSTLEQKISKIKSRSDSIVDENENSDNKLETEVVYAEENTNNVDNNQSVESKSTKKYCPIPFVPISERNLLQSEGKFDPRLVIDLSDQQLLEIFSFLTTSEVINTAQVCRYVYYRIDKLFGIESATVQPEWGMVHPLKEKSPTDSASNTNNSNTSSISAATNTPVKTTSSSTTTLSPITPSITNSSVTTASSSSSNSAQEVRLTREMVDTLTKRLTAQEMKVILGLAEKIKKQTILLDQLTVEKDDFQAQIQTAESQRDMLIEKLKTAEMAIKAMMQEIAVLKKQSASDSEIISYLDLHVQEVDSKLLEANYRAHHLQAALDLQVNTHSQREEQLLSELNDYKLKYEKLDNSFKAQKKMLVKEVKSLRGQVDQLTQENVHYASRFRDFEHIYKSMLPPK